MFLKTQLSRKSQTRFSPTTGSRCILMGGSPFSRCIQPCGDASIGSNGQPIYHTNVMMCIGTAFAMVGLEMIPNKAERQQLRARLEKTGKEIVELSADQIANFAGNAIELHNQGGDKLLVLSSRA